MRNSIDLELSINEFETQFNELDAVVNNLVGVENKKQMIEALSRISSEITTLKNLSNDYTEKVAEQCSDLDPAAMNIEKEKYIKRRELAKMEVY